MQLCIKVKQIHIIKVIDLISGDGECSKSRRLEIYFILIHKFMEIQCMILSVTLECNEFDGTVHFFRGIYSLTTSLKQMTNDEL